MAKLKIKKFKRKKDPIAILSDQNQKYIFQELVLEPVRKTIEKVSADNKLSVTICSLIVLNHTLKKEVRKAWKKLAVCGRIKLPFETVCPSFRIDEISDIFELDLNNNLVCLSNGTLDPRLVPIRVTTL